MPEKPVTYRKLLAFFLPMASTPLLIASIHSIMNAGLARLPYPEMSIAVFTVVKALFNSIKAPGLMTNQVVMAMANNAKSYRHIMRFVWGLCAVLLFLLGLISYTPLGGWVLRNIMGLNDPKHIEFAYTSMKIASILPVFECLRNSYHGLAIRLSTTKILAAGTIVRLIIITMFLWWSVRTQQLSGIVAVSIAWPMGIAIEGLLVRGCVFHYFGSPIKALNQLFPNDERAPLTKEILMFFAPLAIMIILTASLQPVIQSTITRNAIHLTRELSAYGVAWGLIMIITGPIRSLHQCSLAHASNSNWKKVKCFCIMTGAIISLFTFTIAITPVGYWIFNNVISVSKQVATSANEILLAFSIFPFIVSLREAYWGVLMHNHNTTIIGIGKAANLLTVLILATLINLILPWFSAAIIGALAFSAGEAVESLIIWSYIRTRPV